MPLVRLGATEQGQRRRVTGGNRNSVMLICGVGCAVLGGLLIWTGQRPTVETPPAVAASPASPETIAQVNPDTFRPRVQNWSDVVRYQQGYVTVGSTRFPVFSITFNPRDPRVALRPIWSNSAQMPGTRPLTTMGRQWRTFAAINGGFFNRNNQLPLGAIRRENRWYSGPILNRGAIAWDDAGNVLIGRLTLQETAVTSANQRIFLSHLNSGYVQAGVARYTPEWGARYQPLTDGETLITVRNNQVSRQDNGGTVAQARNFAIPSDGYLLVIRARNQSPSVFPVGSAVQIEQGAIAPEFEQFPHILGAGPLLLQNGQVVLNGEAEKFSRAFVQQAASRSLIGQTGNGQLVIAVVHNRPDGRGPTLSELAQLGQRLGLVSALNLDGGSSSGLFLRGNLVDRDPSTAARVHNGLGLYFAE
jgi:hypothetical protein